MKYTNLYAPLGDFIVEFEQLMKFKNVA